jgi:predicted RNA-binding protein YlxR (DUF448 family)
MTERTCVCCNRKRAKDEMLRVSSELEPDVECMAPGRGFYVCPNAKCIDRLDSGKTSIRRSLRIKTIDNIKLLLLKKELTDTIYSRLCPVRVMNV